MADLDGDKVPEILYVARTKAERLRRRFALRALKREKSGTFVPFRWGPEDDVPLKGLAASRRRSAVLDVNRDGQPDVLVFNAYGPPAAAPGPRRRAPRPGRRRASGPLAGVTPAGLSRDGPRTARP